MLRISKMKMDGPVTGLEREIAKETTIEEAPAANPAHASHERAALGSSWRR